MRNIWWNNLKHDKNNGKYYRIPCFSFVIFFIHVVQLFTLILYILYGSFIKPIWYTSVFTHVMRCILYIGTHSNLHHFWLKIVKMWQTGKMVSGMISIELHVCRCAIFGEARIFQSCNNRHIYISHKRHGWHYGLSCVWYAVLFMGFQTIFITRLLKNIVLLATFSFTLLFLFLLLLFAHFRLGKCFVAHLWPLYGIYFGYPKWKRLENKMNCMDMSNWCQVCTLCIHDVQWLWFQWNRDTSITIHQPSFHYGIPVNMCVNSKLYSYVRTWISFVIMSQIHIKCWIAI